VPPAAEALAAAVARLAGSEPEASRLGDAGFARARLITWDGVVEQLLSAALGGVPFAG